MRPCRTAATRKASDCDDPVPRKPTTGNADGDCCERAVSGQVIAVTPKSVMKSRRLNAGPAAQKRTSHPLKLAHSRGRDVTVRFGSFAAIARRARHVRFTPRKRTLIGGKPIDPSRSALTLLELT